MVLLFQKVCEKPGGGPLILKWAGSCFRSLSETRQSNKRVCGGQWNRKARGLPVEFTVGSLGWRMNDIKGSEGHLSAFGPGDEFW